VDDLLDPGSLKATLDCCFVLFSLSLAQLLPQFNFSGRAVETLLDDLQFCSSKLLPKTTFNLATLPAIAWVSPSKTQQPLQDASSGSFRLKNKSLADFVVPIVHRNGPLRGMTPSNYFQPGIVCLTQLSGCIRSITYVSTAQSFWTKFQQRFSVWFSEITKTRSLRDCMPT
jgi:hypothetical protein